MHRDPPAHPALVGTVAQLGLGHGQLGPVVHAGHLHGIGDRERRDLVAGVMEHGDRVGQVVLAVGVLGAEPSQGGRQHAAPEAVHRGVDLVHRPLLLGGVSLLDDARDPAVLVLDQPSVAGGILQAGDEQAGRGVAGPMRPHESGQSRRPEQRRVTREDDHVSVLVLVVGEVRKARQAHRGGVARTALHVLLDELERERARGPLLDGLGDALGAVADDHDHPLDRKLGERVENVEHHGTSAQQVQRLGLGRTHPGPLAGGQHQCRQGTHSLRRSHRLTSLAHARDRNRHVRLLLQATPAVSEGGGREVTGTVSPPA